MTLPARRSIWEAEEMIPRHMVFRPISSIVLAVMVLVFCAIMVVGTVLQGNTEFLLRSIGLIALVGAMSVAAFWLPKLEVTEDEILVRNVFSTVRMRWEAIVSIESRWSLAFRTERGKVTAWASPPANQSVGVGFLIRGMSPSTTARPASTPAAGKTSVTEVILATWDERTDRIDLDRGDARPHRTLNIGTIVVLGVLAAAALAGLLV
jgi:hypothetical protein